MNEIIVATNNDGKAREYRELFAPLGIKIKTLKDFPDLPEIDETGTTFEENALIKAQTVSKATNLPVVADDTGLMIDALNGAPGVYSARYAGNHDDQANIDKVLRNLQSVDLPDRTARFHTSLVAVKPNGDQLLAQGEVEGSILTQQRGHHGFGYDSIVFVNQFNKSMAELTDTQKNEISHRGNAMRNLMTNFETWWNE
jgi:XTP/dITP diphosphohydrolase